MKRSEIRSFVESCLTLWGGDLGRQRDDLLRVVWPAGEGVEPNERWLAFTPQAHRAHPEAELMTIGSAFLDQLVGQARSRGAYAIAYRAAPARRRPPVGRPALPEVEGLTWGPPMPASRPLFLFVYVVEYHTIDVPDDLVLIPFDPALGEALASAGPLLETLRNGSPQAPSGWPALPALPTPGDLCRSLDILDRRLQRRTGHVQEASAIEIARETANIEAYYRQLIDEARHPVGRTPHSPEDETSRVRRLQLDWKRRVQEVSRFWEARGDVRLSTLGVVMEPAWVMPLQRRGARRKKTRTGRPYVVVGRTKEAVQPHCAVCGARLREKAGLLGEDLVCPVHLRAAEAPTEG